MDVRVGLWKKLSAEELMLLNCGVGEDSWESLDCKEIQPVHPKGDQSWVFIGRTDVEAEIPILWLPHAKSWLIGKDPDAGRDWGQEEKGTIEDEMVGWHHQLNRYGFGWTPGVGDGQGGLVCSGSWGSQRVRHDWATELHLLLSSLFLSILYSFFDLLPQGDLSSPTDVIRSPMCVHHVHFLCHMPHSCGLLIVTFISLVID